MNRTQKKCIVASACFHGLLLCVAVFGSGFFSGRTEETVTLLTFIPADATITDGPTRGGGNPNVTTPPAAAAPAAPAPAPPKASAPQVKQREPDPVPEPPKTTRSPEAWSLPKDARTPKKKAAELASENSKTKELTKRELGMNKVVTRDSKKAATGKTSTERTAADQRKADERAAQERAAAVGRALSGISTGTSKGVGVEIPGPGGAAFVNYRDFILSAYKRRFDRELESVGAGLRSGITVDVSITITRDGRVVEKSITRPSGIRVLDDAVRRVIEGVHEIAPFPAEAKDARRTFNLTFEPRVDRLSG